MKITDISKKHRIAMAVLIALGMAGAAAILATGRAQPADEHGHAESHADGEHHGGKADDDHAHASEHGDDEHHGKAGAEHHDEDEAEHDDGQVAMTGAQVQAAGITIEAATAAPIRSSLQLPGEIGFNEDRTAHVVPRVAGVVEGVPANLGQRVRQGQVLAVVGSPAVSEQRAALESAQKRLQLARTTHEREKRLWEEKISPQQDVLQAEQALREAEIAASNARQKLQAIGAAPGGTSLARYELKAPFDGTVVEKHIALGEALKEDAQVFMIADLTSVWAEINVSAKDLGQVRVGERVTVRSTASNEAATGTIAYVGSLLGEQTRTAKARVTLPNPQGAWRPGLFVTVELVTSEAPAAVTVASDAVQQVDDKPVVFVQVPGGFKAQPVQLGRSDGQRVEVLAGLKAGDRHASAGSFVVKSEAGKATATHSH